MYRFCVFALVLKEIIVKDILLSFLLVFLFTLLGFSFALHVLSLHKLPSDDVVYLGATVYDVFAASLGSGDYVQTSRELRSSAGIYFDLFEVSRSLGSFGTLSFLNALEYHIFDFSRLIGDHFCTSCETLVRFGLVTPEL